MSTSTTTTSLRTAVMTTTEQDLGHLTRLLRDEARRAGMADASLHWKRIDRSVSLEVGGMSLSSAPELEVTAPASFLNAFESILREKSATGFLEATLLVL